MLGWLAEDSEDHKVFCLQESVHGGAVVDIKHWSVVDGGKQWGGFLVASPILKNPCNQDKARQGMNVGVVKNAKTQAKLRGEERDQTSQKNSCWLGIE